MSISVLSWNICWECMISDIPTKISMPCINLKKKTGENICAKNVATIINESVGKHLYDFIALQEVASLDVIMSYSPDILQKMKIIQHKIFVKDHYVNLATFYNHNKYDVISVKVGNISRHIHSKINYEGRPYHIIFLSGKTNGKKYIFINLHNGHGISHEILEQNLSKDIHCNDKTHWNVIVAGDFNDNNIYDYWKGITPFKYSKIPSLKNIIVKCSTRPPLTCCSEKDLLQKVGLYGDYILISDGLKYIRKNHVPDVEMLQSSDHLPIKCILMEK
jgi:endonuclease/exonuclease/phosphatase family metal-dependent hydrolase